MKVKKYLKIILIIPFLLVSIILYNRINITELENYYSAFISISLTIATFSITFSFLQYQFSPYKSLLRSVSLKQLLFSYFVILIALVPLFTLFVNKESVPVVSLFLIPILAYSTILLWIIAKDESNPKVLLDRKLSNAVLSNFLQTFDEQSTINIKRQEQFEFSKGDETPMHDIASSHYALVAIPNDPFHYVNNIIDTSLNNADLDIYETALDYFLKLIDDAIANEKSKNLDFLFRLNNLIENSFERLTYSTLNLSKNKAVHNTFIIKIGSFIKSKALVHKQTQEPFIKMASTLTEFAKEILQENNPDGVVLITSLFRQLAQKGIYDNPDKDKHFLFKERLSIFPQQIKVIGQETVKANDSNLLFRCLEELGYLGCSAIKNNHYDAGIESLQALVQLGREAREAHMKCFWTRCALEPIDHADERIWWMLSWVWRLEEKEQAQWIRSFEVAYSRLHGYERGIEIKVENDKPIVNFTYSKKPHIESFSKEQYTREINYINVDDTKEFKLY